MDAHSIPATSGIYRIVHVVTGRMYIGSAVNLLRRKRRHFTELRNNKHQNAKLQRAFNKYGEDAFLFEIIEFILPPFLLEREQYWLDKLKPFDNKGFNIALNAQASYLGLTHSAATREKVRLIRLGTKRSPESCERSRISHLGYKQSEETKERRRIAKLGYTPSAETRTKMSTTQKGRPKDPEKYASQMRTLIVIAPDDTEHIVHGVKRFCREHNLNQSALMRVAKGKQSNHKGFKARFPLS